MTVSRATARRRGKDWERQIRDYCRKLGLDYEQLRETGERDEGDGVLRLPNGLFLVVEGKNTQALNLGPHLEEAKVGAENFARHRGLVSRVFGVLFQKRRGKGTGQAYAVMAVEDFLRLVGSDAGLAGAA